MYARNQEFSHDYFGTIFLAEVQLQLHEPCHMSPECVHSLRADKKTSNLTSYQKSLYHQDIIQSMSVKYVQP